MLIISIYGAKYLKIKYETHWKKVKRLFRKIIKIGNPFNKMGVNRGNKLKCIVKNSFFNENIFYSIY